MIKRIALGNDINIDLTDYLTVENKLATIHLPKRIRPTLVSSSCIKILYAEFDPRSLYGGNVHGTITGWDFLESTNIDLNEITALLALDEISMILLPRFWQVIPSVTRVAELSFLISLLRNKRIRNIDNYLPKVRRKIGNLNKGSVKTVNTNLMAGAFPALAVRPLKEHLNSILSELWICREMVECGFDVMFNASSKGPDFYVNGTGVKLEVTRKTDRFGIRRDETGIWITMGRENFNVFRPPILRATPLISPSRNLIDKIGEELRQGDIVVVDLSTTLDGIQLMSSKILSPEWKKLELKHSMNQAIKCVNGGGRAVVYYARSRSCTAASFVDTKSISDKNE